MELGLTKKHIESRVSYLIANMPPKREEDFRRFDDTYRMDVWAGKRIEGEERTSLPTGFAQVEDIRSMILARPPQWSVPVSGNGGKDEVKIAQKIEAFIYAAGDEMGFNQTCYDAEWYAQCWGEGGFKLWFDDAAPQGEFPLRMRVVNPLEVAYSFNPYGDEFNELVSRSIRTRREIQDEYGVELNVPFHLVSSANEDAMDKWLDDRVTVCEYWKTRVVLDYPVDPVSEAIDYMEQAIAGEKAKPGRKPAKEKVHIKQVINAVFIDDNNSEEWIKPPTVMIGYKTIPYFWWGGIRTGLKDRKWVSSLYALTGGDGHENADGILQTQNIILSLYVAASYRATYNAKVTDSKMLIENGIDYSIDNINPIEQGANVKSLTEPPPQQHALNVIEQLERMMGRIGTPEALTGSLVNNSGASIAGMTSVFMLRLAGMQHERSRVFRRAWNHVIELARYYAGSEGWSPKGDSRQSNEAFTTLRSIDIPSNVNVFVKLSDKYPRDEISMLTLMSNLYSKKLLSFETFTNIFQQIYGMASDTAAKERERILKDQAENSPELARAMGEILATKLNEKAMPPQAKQPPVGSQDSFSNPPVESPAPQPPSSFVPGTVPTREQVAADGNLDGYMNMLGGNIAQMGEINAR